ncbi:hypothetical protein D477_007489 [Arthrobacter crystallopoietes BAB-32]|uniref:Serine aminopeptidase S33 domain-containing protein n=1 Tax=Arthrobacter crystallopoietes BAB-32 TaxID=1246476 RepID=N1UWV1_9MICC|nr:alpha/beta fold hydrolase [Arthrobacter crystallopoietes]EMY34866.1 hypothetical protein D477_007489 [Arthrobacter crystallopoietes BAB-32]
MAAIALENNEVLVRLQPREKLAGLLGDLRFPLASVKQVDVVADAFDAVRGFRAPGLAIPGRTRIGTWRRRSGKLFAVARRGEPAVRMELAGEAFSTVVVCVEDPAGIAEQVRLAADLPLAPQFTEEEVRFQSGGLGLAGSWMRPEGRTLGVALILPGSGEIDRNADHRRIPLGISRDLARSLAARGIASLRYDKRGTGSSGGTFLSAGFAQNTDDATAALRWTSQRAGGLPVFLVGHSEGSYHAAALAAEQEVPLAGAVLLSASAHSGFETARWQTAQISRTLPAFPRMLLKLLRQDLAKLQAKSVAKIQATTGDVARMQGRRMNALWWREFLDFDPMPYLRRIQVLVLAATGTKDLQVDPADLDLIAVTVPGPVTTHRLEDLSHLLRRDPAGPSMSDYKRQVREPVDAELLDLVSGWIGRQAEAEAPAGTPSSSLA